MKTLIEAIENDILDYVKETKDENLVRHFYTLRNSGEIRILAPESFDMDQLKVGFVDLIVDPNFKLDIMIDPTDSGDDDLLKVNLLICQGHNTMTLAHKPLMANILSLNNSRINRLFTSPESKPGLIDIENSTVESSLIDCHATGHAIKVAHSHLTNTVLLTTVSYAQCSVENSLIRSIKDQQIVLLDAIDNRRIIIDEAPDPHDDGDTCVRCTSHQDYLILHPSLAQASMPLLVNDHARPYHFQQLWAENFSVFYGLSEPGSFFGDKDAPFGYLRAGGNYSYILHESQGVWGNPEDSIEAFEAVIEVTDVALDKQPYRTLEQSLASTISKYQANGYFV